MHLVEMGYKTMNSNGIFMKILFTFKIQAIFSQILVKTYIYAKSSVTNSNEYISILKNTIY